jgi:[ribosomal protein S5]-alanine N-acetyltransferase
MDWKNIPEIDCGRVKLRVIAAGDESAIYDIYSDPKVIRYWGEAAMKSGDEKRFVRGAQEDIRQRTCIQWGIIRKTDPGIVGIISLFAFDHVAKKAEIGFALARAYWGNGFMREALYGAISFAIREMNLRRIEADVDPRNTPAIKLLEALGFAQEGYLRERWLTPEETQDSLFFGLLSREWTVDVDYRLTFPHDTTIWRRLAQLASIVHLFE